MVKSKTNALWIITTNGSDGACSAAMLLQVDPEAKIVVTSQNRLSQTLDKLSESAAKGSKVSICGVGMGDQPEAILAALTRFCLTGAEVTWYCGRGYLDVYEEKISNRCFARFFACESNTEAVYKACKPGKNKQTSLLLKLAAEYCAKNKSYDTATAWWHDFIEASVARYFNFGDEASYPSCIRKLAGLDAVTPADRDAAVKQQEQRAYALPVGNSPAMKSLRAMTARLGPIDEPVLIFGPSGAGKESVARRLHKASSRSEGRFVVVNCATLSTNPDLVHDRLFGHKPGAFTGAKTGTKGAFIEADGGTLFLDEIGELPLDAQSQLLRVLEERKVYPLGTMEPYPVNVRIVAATHRNLAEMVKGNTFRLDLFYRLNVLSLNVPPLKERIEDMKSIAGAVQHELRAKGHPLKITPDDWNLIQSYDWPGNVRQFRNTLKRAAYMKTTVSEALAIEMGQFDTDATRKARTPDFGLLMPQDMDSITPVEEVRKAYMRHCLNLCDGNWTWAAQRLGIVTNTLRKQLDAPKQGRRARSK